MLQVYEEKLRELKKEMRAFFDRVKEYQERPKAIEALNSILNYSEHFLVGMKNFTGEDQPFTEVELTTLGKLINDTKVCADCSYNSLVLNRLSPFTLIKLNQ